MANKNISMTLNQKRELVIRRSYDYPREVVFKTWTGMEHLAYWWGPQGFPAKGAQPAPKTGGDPSPGQDPSLRTLTWWCRAVYREITAPERILFVSFFSDENGGITRHPLIPTWPLEILNTLTFQERDGKTTVTYRVEPLHATEDERKTFEAELGEVKKDLEGTFDQLAGRLEHLQE